jgi:starvation-inducible DNA-binding protein
LHLMFEGQYTEMALAVDLIAERIRALGAPAPGSYAAFLKLASIKEAEGVPPATEMIKELLAAHESLVRTLRVGLAKLDGVNDQATEDLFTQRLQLHEKTAWMLRSLLE